MNGRIGLYRDTYILHTHANIRKVHTNWAWAWLEFEFSARFGLVNVLVDDLVELGLCRVAKGREGLLDVLGELVEVHARPRVDHRGEEAEGPDARQEEVRRGLVRPPGGEDPLPVEAPVGPVRRQRLSSSSNGVDRAARACYYHHD